MPTTAEPASAVATAPSATQIVALRQVREYPAISVLLTTTCACTPHRSSSSAANAPQRRSGASVNCARLAGTVTGNLTHAHRSQLATRIRTVLEAYLHRRQREALALIDKRMSAGRVVSGMPAAWLAARTGHPELLAVDESLFYPARLSDDGNTLTPADDPEHPDVIDDAVDELIELVLTRGGWVAFTDPGALDQHHGIALTTRR